MHAADARRVLVRLARVTVSVLKQIRVYQVATPRCFDGTLAHGDDLGERHANDFEAGLTIGGAPEAAPGTPEAVPPAARLAGSQRSFWEPT